MKKESNKEKISLDALEMISGGTGPNDFDMESMQRYMQEREEIARENQNEPLFPHSKRATGKLIKR